MGVRRIALVALLGTLSLGGIASADEIVVQGDKLRGTVVTVTAKTVVFETKYGKGNIEIPIEEVQSITTEKEYVFSHGDDDTTQAGSSAQDARRAHRASRASLLAFWV